MTRVEIAPEVANDFDRIIAHLLQHSVDDALSRIEAIIRAIDVLERNPLIGRRVRGATRELIIGRHSGGYVALYRYIPEIDTVFVLAVRSQLEAGHARS